MEPEGETRFEPLCFLLNSLLNNLRLGPGAGEAGGDIIAKDMDVSDAGDAGGIGVILLLEIELGLDWEVGGISEASVFRSAARV